MHKAAENLPAKPFLELSEEVKQTFSWLFVKLIIIYLFDILVVFWSLLTFDFARDNALFQHRFGKFQINGGG